MSHSESLSTGSVRSLKRKASSDISSASDAVAPSASSHKLNVGGASQLSWVNILANDVSLGGARDNLFGKIKAVEESGGCTVVKGFTEKTRPVMDKKFLEVFKRISDSAPERYSPYVISLIQHRKLVPPFAPPRYPEALRKVNQKRTKTSMLGDQAATWVASHLCHNRRCVNIDHLCWEPSWMNRLRDNCPGGASCMHGPARCLRPHRNDEDVIDWTKFLNDEEAAIYFEKILAEDF